MLIPYLLSKGLLMGKFEKFHKTLFFEENRYAAKIWLFVFENIFLGAHFLVNQFEIRFKYGSGRKNKRKNLNLLSARGN